MPRLTNPKHEHFCHLMVQGWTADAAYKEVGYKANRGNATRMNAKESIQSRIAELQERTANRTDVTLELLSEKLLETYRDNAHEDGNQSARVSALMGLAKLHGLETDPRKNDRTPLKDLDDAALAGTIERLASEAGLGDGFGRKGSQTTH